MAPKKAGDDAHTASALIAKYGKMRSRGPQCFLAGYPRNALVMELLGGGMSVARVVEVVLAEYGDVIKAQSLARHYRHECLCPR